MPEPARAPRFSANSLSFRLFVLATVWSLVALAAAAIFLLENYRAGIERGHQAFINVHLLNVVASVEREPDGSLTGSPETGDPRFLSLYSGWYWQVTRQDDPADRLLSPSLGGEQLELPPSSEVPYDEDFRRVVSLSGPEDSTLRAVEQLILMGEDEDAYSFVVASDVAGPAANLARFRTRLLTVFAVLGAGLVAVTVLQVRFGLRPLRRVRQALIDIREGQAERLEGEFPREIAPLTQEINALIEANAKTIERARTHVGNLAHALKTPLSVITNEAQAARGPLGDKIAEQAGVMRHQLDYYLDRARMAARVGVIGVVTDVWPVVQSLERTMRRIYSDRPIAITTTVADGVRFQGERQDLEEMIGNLVDNACKWAGSSVRLECRALAGPPARLEIVVDDDGPGLSPEEREQAMHRGLRLDESKPGSGLGLSIVRELAEVYQGRLELSQTDGGGLRARLELPGA